MLQAAFYGVENYPEVSKNYPFTEGADNRNELSVSCGVIISVDLQLSNFP